MERSSPGHVQTIGNEPGQTSRHRLSLIVPTYNERENLPILLERVEKALRGVSHQIVVVDDNSPDGTWQVVQGASALSGNVILVKRAGKMGLASAFLDGLERCDGEVVGLMDADLQHPPELLPKLLEGIDDGADIAIGSRFVRGGGVGSWSAWRRLVSWGARLLATLVLPKTSGVRDTVSGFFLVRREVIEDVPLSARSFKVLLEILAKGRYGKVVEVPYVFEPRLRGRSKLGSGEMWNYARHVLRLSLETREYLTFLMFCLVGLSGVVVNEAVFWALTSPLKVYYVIAGALSAETAIFNNFVWNDSWTFKKNAPARSKPRLVRFVLFNVSMAGGVTISLVVLYLLATSLKLNVLVANLGAIVVSMLWNYATSAKFVWT